MSVRRRGRIWMLPVFLGCIGSTLASASEPSASAFGAQVAMTLVGQPPSDVGPLAPSNTAGPTSATVSSATTVPGILTAGALITVADLNAGSDTASASSTNVTLPLLWMLGPVTALNIQASCSATPGAITGSATFTNATFGYLGAVPDHPAINTSIPIFQPGIIGQIGLLILNEQISNADGSLTVNALHLHLTGPDTGEGDVVVSSATCGAGAIFLDNFEGTTPANTGCEARANDSTSKLVECIRNYYLWRHLVAFQQIADANPGPDGHPSRTLGEPGYLASVNYVAGLMTAAGYNVTVQQYTFPYVNFTATPSFGEVSPTAGSYVLKTDWNPATYSGSGDVTATVQPVAGIIIPATPDPSSASGCTSGDFAGFTPWQHRSDPARNMHCHDQGCQCAGCRCGRRHCLQRRKPGPHRDAGMGLPRCLQSAIYPGRVEFLCGRRQSVLAGAKWKSRRASGHFDCLRCGSHRLQRDCRFSVRRSEPCRCPRRTPRRDLWRRHSRQCVRVLDDPRGGPEDGAYADHNQLRYVWFGGEELGIYGSQYYTQTLAAPDAQKIVFDLDSDVTATPNFEQRDRGSGQFRQCGGFPPNVVPGSQVGNNYFVEYFEGNALPYALERATTVPTRGRSVGSAYRTAAS